MFVWLARRARCLRGVRAACAACAPLVVPAVVPVYCCFLILVDCRPSMAMASIVLLPGRSTNLFLIQAMLGLEQARTDRHEIPTQPLANYGCTAIRVAPVVGSTNLSSLMPPVPTGYIGAPYWGCLPLNHPRRNFMASPNWGCHRALSGDLHAYRDTHPHSGSHGGRMHNYPKDACVSYAEL